MDDKLWDHVGDLIISVLALPPDQRSDFLDQACASAPALRAQIDAFLDDHDAAFSFFDHLGESLHPNVEAVAAGFSPAATSDPYALTGQPLGRYTDLEPLGGGGMGVVYKARDPELKRTVALKLMPPLLSHHPQARERFLVEAQAAAALEHPNICTIYEVGQSAEGQPFIAMAYYGGRTLRERIAEGPLPIDEALGVAVEMAEGLARAHEGGTVHRDVKPANVMLTDRGRVRILDFGLAKVADVQLTKTGTTMGTAAYMSPEQAKGEAVDHRTDVWSLGVVLYEMLTGERPFKGDYEQAVMYAILHEEPAAVRALRPEVSEALAQVVANALVKDPAGRYPTMAAMRADLRAVQKEDAPIVSKRPRTASRSGKRVIFGGVVLVVLVVAALFAFWPRETTSEERKSIAVLPFENRSADSTDIYFSDGVTEDIIAHLSQIGALRVTPRATSMRYRGSEQPLREISEALGVATLLTGSVRRQGDKVRIGVELIDPARDERLWGETFDKELADIFAIQSEVAREIAGALQAELTTTEQTQLAQRPTGNPEAYDLYLQGRAYYRRFLEDANEQAIVLFKQAIALDPDFVDAYAILSFCYGQRALRHGYDIAWIDSSLVVAEQALALNPNAPLALNAMGFVHDTRAQNSLARDYRLRALAVDSTAPAGALAYMYLRLGALEESHRWLRHTWMRDPSFAMTSADLGDLSVVLHDYDQAMQWYEQALALQPDFHEARLFWANLELLQGNHARALELAQQVLAVTPEDNPALWTAGFSALLMNRPDQARAFLERQRAALNVLPLLPGHFSPWESSMLALLGYLDLQQGQTDRAETLFDQSLAAAQRRLDDGSENAWLPYDQAAVHTVRGDHEAAYAALDEAVRLGWRVTDRARIDPMLASLRGETRFEALLDRVDAMVAEARARIEASEP